MIFRVTLEVEAPGKIAFIDRDGTLIRDDGYLSDPEEIHEINEARASLVRLKEEGWCLFLISNQAGLAKGIISREDFDRVRRRFEELFDPLGEIFKGVFYCPHHRDGTVPYLRRECQCRKPGTTMVEGALSVLDSVPPPSHIYVVGDKRTDIILGKRMGFRTILTLTGHGRNEKELIRDPLHFPDFMVSDFDEAVTLLTERVKT